MIGTFSLLYVFRIRTSVFFDKAVVVIVEVVETVVVVGDGVVVVKARDQQVLIELKCLIKVTVIKIKSKL